MYLSRRAFSVCLATFLFVAAALLVTLSKGGSGAKTINGIIDETESSPSRMLQNFHESTSTILRNGDGYIRFTDDDVKRLVRASQLMKLSYDERVYTDTVVLKAQKGFDYLYGKKRFTIAKYPDDNVCYAAFRGTASSASKGALADWRKNLNLHGVAPPYFANCGMRKGFFDQFVKRLGGLAEMDQAVAQCETQCGPNCHWVLTGHSLGGATAVVASINNRFRDKNPDVITFGAPAAIDRGCRAIEDKFTNYFRFIMSDFRDGANYYDIVPASTDLAAKGATHYGRTFVIGELANGTPALSYVGDNDNKKRKGSFPRQLSDVKDFHSSQGYMDSMIAWRDSLPGGFAHVDVHGFPDGTRCKYGDECRSGRCSGGMDSVFTCKPKKAPGGSCGVDGVCLSNKCSMSRKCK